MNENITPEAPESLLDSLSALETHIDTLEVDIPHVGTVFSPEAISFQGDSYKTAMTGYLEEVYDICVEQMRSVSGPFDVNKKRLAEYLEPVHAKMRKLVKDEMGIKVLFHLTGNYNAYVYPNTFNHKNVLYGTRGDFPDAVINQNPDVFRKLKTEQEKGWVDLKNGKVGGIFSEQTINVYYSPTSFMLGLEDTLTPAEVAAIITHELGHAFTYFEYSDRLSYTNAILQNIVEEATDIKDDAKRQEYIIKEVKSKKLLDKKEIKELQGSNNRLVMGFKLFKLMNQKVGTQLINARYSDTNSEALADNFASRYGYAREIVTGLNKVYEAFGAPEKASNPIWYGILSVLELFVTLCMYLMFSFIWGFLFGMLGGSVVGAVIGVMLLVLFVAGAGDEHRDLTYDDLQDRFTRLYHDQIARLKNSSRMSKELKGEILLSLEEMKAIIDDTRNHVGIMTTLSNFLFSSNRQAHKEKEFQKLLESLAHNELIVKAQQLSIVT